MFGDPPGGRSSMAYSRGDAALVSSRFLSSGTRQTGGHISWDTTSPWSRRLLEELTGRRGRTGVGGRLPAHPSSCPPHDTMCYARPAGGFQMSRLLWGAFGAFAVEFVRIWKLRDTEVVRPR